MTHDVIYRGLIFYLISDGSESVAQRIEAESLAPIDPKLAE